jgi:transcriptional regulator of NAD metabolism
MNGDERRDKILDKINRTDGPLSASALASEFNVSRQIIVGDVSLLRASGALIKSTPRGYLPGTSEFAYIGTVVCKHGFSQLKEELYTIADYGGTCIDVTIDHEIYGELTGQLNVSSRFDADIFLEKCSDKARPLSFLSGGVHTHRIGCRDREVFSHIVKALTEKQILIQDS